MLKGQHGWYPAALGKKIKILDRKQTQFTEACHRTIELLVEAFSHFKPCHGSMAKFDVMKDDLLDVMNTMERFGFGRNFFSTKK